MWKSQWFVQRSGGIAGMEGAKLLEHFACAACLLSIAASATSYAQILSYRNFRPDGAGTKVGKNRWLSCLRIVCTSKLSIRTSCTVHVAIHIVQVGSASKNRATQDAHKFCHWAELGVLSQGPNARTHWILWKNAMKLYLFTIFRRDIVPWCSVYDRALTIIDTHVQMQVCRSALCFFVVVVVVAVVLGSPSRSRCTRWLSNRTLTCQFIPVYLVFFNHPPGRKYANISESSCQNTMCHFCRPPCNWVFWWLLIWHELFGV